MRCEPTVYVVDDEQAIRDALQRNFSKAGLSVETFASAGAFLAAYQPPDPGCLLLDVQMPNVDGLELQQTLSNQGITLPIVFLTGTGEVATAVKALKSGAVDYIQKPIRHDQLLECVRQVLQADLVACNTQLQQENIDTRLATLTPREQEVMQWLVEGQPNKKIAKVLGISPRTVEVHRKNVLDKMQVKSVARLINLLQNRRFCRK